ncbi:hypothetical protein D9M70_463410 [compost metagenome]
MLGAEPRELARFLVIDRGRFEVLALGLVLCRPGVAAGLGNAGTTEHHYGGIDAAFFQHHLGLHEFELQPDRAQFLAAKEIVVDIGEAIGGRCRLRRDRNRLRSLPALRAVGQWIPDPVLAAQCALLHACHRVVFLVAFRTIGISARRVLSSIPGHEGCKRSNALRAPCASRTGARRCSAGIARICQPRASASA